MGIKGFASWLRARFPIAFTSAKIPYTTSGLGVFLLGRGPFVYRCTFDEVYIDLNSYLYQSAMRSSSPKQVLKHLEARLLSTLNAVRARRRVFISIDGVAPVAKLDVQRSRRASKAIESARTKLFDAQNFTPGCLFMGQVEEALKHLGSKYTARQGPDFEFIISGASVKEEGEIKIAHEIAYQHHHCERDKKVARAVLTVDSDAFLQAFVHEIPSLFILNASDLKSGSVSCFSGEMMREELRVVLPKVPDTRQAQADFALLCIFSGNDCVSALPFGGVSYLWADYLEYVDQACGRHAGLIDPKTMRLDLEGLVTFAKYVFGKKMNAGTQKLVDAYRDQFQSATPVSTEIMVDYLTAVQWSFSRLTGSPVSQTLSFFLSPKPPTFFDLGQMALPEAIKLFSAAIEAKENKLDRRKLPAAAAIMMLDPNSETSVSYIAAPLRGLFKSFHADELCTLDDHSRFKKLCKQIMEVPKESFTAEELAVSFPRMPEHITKRKPHWRPYDPPGRGKHAEGSPAEGDEDAPVSDQHSKAQQAPSVPLTPCPVFMKLFGKKLSSRTIH